MARTPSTMIALGTPAPDFSLPGVDGRTYSLHDFDTQPVLLVMFICNHCPFVKHLAGALAQLGRDFLPRGAAIVAISSNDATAFPDDSFEKMKDEVRERGYLFPYLFDESQEVAQRFRAACTPDFFLFDRERKLVYRGQFDSSRPDNGQPVTGKDVRHALEALLAGKTPAPEQWPSIGCNIKWRPGNEPEYFK